MTPLLRQLLACWAALCLALQLAAQPQLPVQLAADFAADGAIVELTAPPAAAGAMATLGWVGPGGRSQGTYVTLRGGKQLVDLRGKPAWRGRVRQLATDARGVRATVRAATAGDELALFLEPELLAPRAINLVEDRALIGWRWYWVVALIFGAASGVAWWRVRRWATALMLGFLVAWGAVALRGVVNHAGNVSYQLQRGDRAPAALESLGPFADRCDTEIESAKWAKRVGVSGFASVYLHYRLAEHPFAAPGMGRPDYLIARGKANGELVFADRGLRLFELNK